MSYCHQWGRPAVVPSSSFSAFVAESRALRRALGTPGLFRRKGVRIGDAHGFGWPVFREDVVCFNGKPPMEPLLIHRVFHRQDRPVQAFGLHWDYVKTNQEPYDVLVVAVLCSFKHHVPAAALSSDGGAADWAPGIALYEGATGRRAPSLKELSTPQAER